MPPLEGCRLPLNIGLLPLPVDPISTAMTCSLRSTGITPLHHYYEAVRPRAAHRCFRPRGFGRLCLFPCHRRPGSQVPCKSPNESHASSTPDTAWPIRRFPPYFSRSWGEAPVLMSSESVFDASPEIRLRSSLSSILGVINVTPFDHNVHHRGFWPKQLMAV